MISTTTEGAISSGHLERFERELQSRPTNRMAMNALTRGNLQEIAINRRRLNELDHDGFSCETEPGGPITDQKRAATCWLFADMNWLRHFVLKKLNVASFEFSENYGIFWDKFEKANYFLENIIRYRDRPWDDRRVYHLMDSPAPDGGEWHMLANVIDKYGLVPKSAMPDTFNREVSRFMNEILFYKLREGAVRIRRLHRQGKPVQALRELKLEILALAYRILVIMLGEPPRRFDFAWRDKDKKFHRDAGLTPKDWYAKYVGIDPDDVFTLLSCSLPDTPFHSPMKAEFFDNMVGGRTYICLNLPLSDLRRKAIQVLRKGEPCLFGADVVQDCHTKEGVLDRDVFELEELFGFPFSMDRTTRVQTLQERMTHAMVFTGVDLVDGQPARWKVENSWGTEVGRKGFFVMSQSWFDEHVFDVVVRREYMTKRWLKELEKEPVLLPPWHPML